MPVPDQLLRLKSSFFNLSKNPLHAALSGLHPFADMLLTGSFSSHIATYSGQRQWPPRSEWTTVAAPGRLWATAFSRLELARALLGWRPIDQAAGLPSKQSTTALR